MPYQWSQSVRSRHLAAISAAIALTVFAAGCGSKSDDGNTPTAQVPATTATAAGGATDGATGDTSGGTTDGTTDAGSSTPAPGTENAPHRKPSSDTIATLASKDDDLTNLSTALGAANLTSLLGQAGPYTVFAPNNDGFAKLGTQLDTLLQPSAQSQLADILKFHIVEGQYRTKNLKDGQLLTTVQGTRLRVYKTKDGQVSVGNSLGKATVVESDIDAGNGIIHVVDTVLTPKKSGTS